VCRGLPKHTTPSAHTYRTRPPDFANPTGLAPDRERRPGRLAQGVVLLGMAGFAVFAVTGIVTAYSV
jgi:hypothetical protein